MSKGRRESPCYKCQHWIETEINKDGYFCKAYPDGTGIADIFVLGEEHTEVMPDQTGDFVFKPQPEGYFA
jgi:hypothetical protein